MTIDKLYSNIPEERLTAALEVKEMSVIDQIKKIKQYFWFGSANAWLVFLGTSPGGSSTKGKEDKSNYKSEISFNEASNHLLNFNDSKGKKGFWEKIRGYAKELFPEIPESELYKIMLAGNLMDSMEGDSSKLNVEELQKGAIESFDVLSIVKPKLIICLQQNVYELIYKLVKEKEMEQVQASDILQIKSGTKRDIEYKVPVIYFQSKDIVWDKWVLTRMPMHPSRSNFCDATNLKEQFLQKLVPLANKFLSL